MTLWRHRKRGCGSINGQADELYGAVDEQPYARQAEQQVPAEWVGRL